MRILFVQGQRNIAEGLFHRSGVKAGGKYKQIKSKKRKREFVLTCYWTIITCKCQTEEKNTQIMFTSTNAGISTQLVKYWL